MWIPSRVASQSSSRRWVKRAKALWTSGAGEFQLQRREGEEGLRGADVPDIRADREAWFSYWDEQGSGALGKEDMIRALMKTFGWRQGSSAVAELRMLVELLWSEFDPDGC